MKIYKKSELEDIIWKCFREDKAELVQFDWMSYYSIEKYWKDEAKKIMEEKLANIPVEFWVFDSDILYEGYSNTKNYLVEAVNHNWWGEWDWEDMDITLKILIKESKEELFVQFDWYFNGWQWSEWETFYQVEPKEVMVTKYFAV